MTNPDYRAMCAELVAAWDALPWEYNWLGNVTGIHCDRCDDSAVARARALLDQPTPQPPADGEVAELVEWLQDCADVRNDEGYTSLGYKYFRAAELLKRYALPTPEAP